MMVVNIFTQNILMQLLDDDLIEFEALRSRMKDPFIVNRSMTVKH